MKHLSIVIFPGIAVIVLAALFVRGSVGVSASNLPSHTHYTSTCGVWSKVSSPNVGTSTNFLNGVAAIAANNIWAVGEDTNSAGPSAMFAPLIEHWNGPRWSIVASPLQGTSDFLNGIAAVSASNIWAVGDYRSGIDPMGSYYTLIEHWNGTTWSVVKSPSPGSIVSNLTSATRVPATSTIWSAGFIQGSTSQTLTAFYC